jgi:hypothetical protein
MEIKENETSTYKQNEATALREFRKLVADRNAWAGFTKELCGVMEKLLLMLMDKCS